jgi:hypothetical protein
MTVSRARHHSKESATTSVACSSPVSPSTDVSDYSASSWIAASRHRAAVATDIA